MTLEQKKMDRREFTRGLIPVILAAGLSFETISSSLRHARATETTQDATNPASLSSYSTYEYWFTWYDFASPNAKWDAVHMTNPATVSVNASLYVAGTKYADFNIPPGAQTYWYKQGVIGGPVKIVANGRLLVSKRTDINGFDELWAQEFFRP